MPRLAVIVWAEMYWPPLAPPSWIRVPAKVT